jgi:hypothetical protein
MKLKLDENYDMWFHHNDCNEDFEKLDDLMVTNFYDFMGPKGKTITHFKFVLSEPEKAVLNRFEAMCKPIIEDYKVLDKYA